MLHLGYENEQVKLKEEIIALGSVTKLGCIYNNHTLQKVNQLSTAAH